MFKVNSTFRPFCPPGKLSLFHLKERWVDFRTFLSAVKKKVLTLQGNEPDSNLVALLTTDELKEVKFMFFFEQSSNGQVKNTVVTLKCRYKTLCQG